jgi:hypothetical protein
MRTQVARDGRVQLWDHDFDPQFEKGQDERAKRIIASYMHLAGKSTKWREADYYYTKRVAERLQTNWSKYSVHGGDFDWNQKAFHNPMMLQRNPTFCDIGQASFAHPTKKNTFQCAPGLLCSRDWQGEIAKRFHDYLEVPTGLPLDQIVYTSGQPLSLFGTSDVVIRKGGAMYNEDGSERNQLERDAYVQTQLVLHPDYWENFAGIYGNR